MQKNPDQQWPDYLNEFVSARWKGEKEAAEAMVAEEKWWCSQKKAIMLTSVFTDLQNFV